LLRRRRQYRRIDRILLVRGLSLVAPYSRYFKNRLLPDFMHNQAMGIKSIFE